MDSKSAIVELTDFLFEDSELKYSVFVKFCNFP